MSTGLLYGYIEIEYEAQINDISVEMKKNTLGIGERPMIMNQGEAFIDMDLFANKQMLTLERAGNLSIEIYGQGQAPEIMDYYQDYNIHSVILYSTISGNNWLALAKRGFSYFNLREKNRQYQKNLR